MELRLQPIKIVTIQSQDYWREKPRKSLPLDDTFISPNRGKSKNY